jgi:hypothetical protein
MNELELAAAHLGAFFRRHNIDTESLTVILNVTDRHAAAELDYAIKSSFKAYELNTRCDALPDIRRIELRGLKISVESPLHTP